jgi:protoporphyrinogen oxidase
MKDFKTQVLILGGGLTGLSAAYTLSRAGLGVKVFESDSAVGGLSKTIVQRGFRFDLGGHRFFTQDKKIDGVMRSLMTGELITVSRKSKIYMRNRYFDYPLKPLNAIFGMGIPTTMKILSDYGNERIKQFLRDPVTVSLEDWVVSKFGRRMFDVYFKEYSEKVWGIDCSRISAEWVSQRIRGLSLAEAIKNAFFKLHGRNIPTLADRFIYPQQGIGRISDRFREEIERSNEVVTGTRVERINHTGFSIDSIAVKNHSYSGVIKGREFVSSLPITTLVQLLHPAPPEDILRAASKLRFRDLIIVSIMINRKRVTDQTWVYIPEKKIPFGRIHEPTNWSEEMAPPGKTLLVAEFFTFKGDSIWNEPDDRLVDITTDNLEKLGFARRQEVIDSAVIRVSKAYPLFEVGYRELCDELYEYLGRFGNLHIAGRTGMFRYYNMDHAIESGMTTAEKIIKGNGAGVRIARDGEEEIPEEFTEQVVA